MRTTCQKRFKWDFFDLTSNCLSAGVCITCDGEPDATLMSGHTRRYHVQKDDMHKISEVASVAEKLI
jgi:hypothetical protein